MVSASSGEALPQSPSSRPVIHGDTDYLRSSAYGTVLQRVVKRPLSLEWRGTRPDFDVDRMYRKVPRHDWTQETFRRPH